MLTAGRMRPGSRVEVAIADRFPGRVAARERLVQTPQPEVDVPARLKSAPRVGGAARPGELGDRARQLTADLRRTARLVRVPGARPLLGFAPQTAPEVEGAAQDPGARQLPP